MRAIVLLFLVALGFSTKAQTSDFPKNYVGLFYTLGYYTEEVEQYYGMTTEGIDFNTLGITAARRLTKNFYVQTNAFSANGDYFFIDLGVKANFAVEHQLQPTASFSMGSKLGYDEASNTYFGFGLDWHIAPNIVLNGSVNSDVSGLTYGMRFGGMYKF